MIHNESKLQIQCVKWIKLQYPNIICMAIPNGGKRNKIEASIMKAEGVYSGASDLFIPIYNGRFYGLFIEMKFGKGVLTENQKKFRDNVQKNGYCFEICHSLDEFITIINNYFTKNE